MSVPVTQLAKWKTTLQLVAVGFLIAGKRRCDPAGGDPDGATLPGFGLADAVHWLGLFRAGVRHLIEESVEAALFRPGASERIGKPRGGDRAAGHHWTVADLMRWLAMRGEEYAHAFENPKVIRAATTAAHVKADTRSRAREIAFSRR